MNWIEIFGPKIIVLLAIWIPGYAFETKVVLSIIWQIKLLLDYDIQRPGHSGYIYKIFSIMPYGIMMLLVALIGFIPTLFFEYVVIKEKCVLLIILGAVSLLFNMEPIISSAKDIIKSLLKN